MSLLAQLIDDAIAWWANRVAAALAPTADIAADDALIEDLRHHREHHDDQLTRLLAAVRDDAQHPST